MFFNSLTTRSARLLLLPRIMVLTLSGIALLAVAVAAVSYVILRDDATSAARERVDSNMKVAWDVLHQKGDNFRQVDGRLLAGDHVLNGDLQVVDKIKELVGGTATVFMGDIRVATNVAKADGSRAVGTPLAPGAAYDAVIGHNASFRGEVDILGEPYMTAYDPIRDATGKTIGILYVGLKKAEFLTAAEKTLEMIVSATLLVMTLAGALSFLVISRSVTRPLDATIRAMRQLAEGQLDAPTPSVARHDEIGEITRTLGVFREGLLTARDLAERQKIEQLAKEQAAVAQGHLVEQFNSKVVEVIECVVSSATRLETDAEGLSVGSEQTGAQAANVAAASEQAAANVQTVAAASEELAASSREIAAQVGRASMIAQNAATTAAATDDLVSGLAAAASKIGDVVNLINDIANQTNLLALNATIEAARAGEAGKGFAVVAHEVKSLANQTARATEEISGQISAVQQQTDQAVDAIRNIGATIAEMDEVSGAIAAAVEEQGAATQEITRNIQEAHAGTVEVARNVVGVSKGAQDSSASARNVFSAAKELHHEAESMRAVADSFLIRLQSGGASLEWSDAWVSGHPTIDADHKMLLQYVNELNQAMVEGKGRDIAAGVLDKLVSYTREHFAREEAIWEKGGLVSLAQHRKIHADLVGKVEQFQRAFLAGQATLTTDLMAFLREWLIDHVFKTDKAGVREIGISVAA
jgi:methyl-accepting chemotaxis protein